MIRRERVGSEPANARSAYVLRAVLAAVGLVVCAAGAAGAWATSRNSPDSRWTITAVVLGVLGLAAVIDLVVVVRRLREERRPLR